MPTTPLLTTTVRPDWEELSRQRALRQARYWNGLQLGLVFSTLLVLLLKLAFPSWGWHGMMWEVLFIPFAWILPLMTIYQWAPRDRPESPRRTLAATGVILAALVLVCASAPLTFAMGAEVREPNLRPPWGSQSRC